MGRILPPTGVATTGCNSMGGSGGASSQTPHRSWRPDSPLLPRMREPVLVALGPHIRGRLLVEGVTGCVVLDEADH